MQLCGYEAAVPTTPTHIGMRPVPMEPRIDFAVVTSDPAKVQDHARETNNTYEQENGDRAFRRRCGLRVC